MSGPQKGIIYLSANEIAQNVNLHLLGRSETIISVRNRKFSHIYKDMTPTLCW